MKKAREKAHILEGLAVALSNIDEMIILIKESKNSQEAKEKLLSKKWKAGLIHKMLDSSKGSITKPEDLNENLGLVKNQYLLSENQAQAILEMKLSRLTALEQDKIMLDFGQGASVQRYKGLGEMNAEQLWDTTMNPEYRTLRKIVVENQKRADETFSILMGDDVPPRREFIENNAVYANIDV